MSCQVGRTAVCRPGFCRFPAVVRLVLLLRRRLTECIWVDRSIGSGTSKSPVYCSSRGLHVRRGCSREALPLLRPTPPNHTRLHEVKCTQHVDSQTSHGLPHIHPKIGSTVQSRWRVRVAGKPSDGHSQGRNPKSDRYCTTTPIKLLWDLGLLLFPSLQNEGCVMCRAGSYKMSPPSLSSSMWYTRRIRCTYPQW